jgi:hypothetical protein
MNRNLSFATRRVAVAFALMLAGVSGVPACAQAPRDAIAAGAFAYDRSAPLDLRDSLERVDGDVEVHAISFASPRGGRATGLLFVPRGGAARKPGIVQLHGAPGSARSIAAGSLRLARRGAVLISIDAPFARRGGGMVTFTEADSADHVQLIVDLQRAWTCCWRGATWTRRASPSWAAATAARWAPCTPPWTPARRRTCCSCRTGGWCRT